MAIVGTQITFFGLFALAIARQLGLRVARGLAENLLRLASRQSSVAIGVLLMIAGASGAIYAEFNWSQQSFGPLVPSEIMRITIPSATLIAIGIQMVFGAFMLGFIEMDGRFSPTDSRAAVTTIPTRSIDWRAGQRQAMTFFAPTLTITITALSLRQVSLQSGPQVQC
jgi:hypothetical protein